MKLFHPQRLCSLIVFCFLFLALPGSLAAAKTAATKQAPDVAAEDPVHAALLHYQAALDQISQGRLGSARLLLEDGVRRYGDRPEMNLLLAYVLEREGDSTQAQKHLARVAPASPLAAEYSRLLQTPPNAAQSQRGSTASRQDSVPAAASSSVNQNTSQPATSTSLRQTDARLARLEEAMIQLVNAERRKQGLAELVSDEVLATVARAHSAEMRDRDYFSHQSPTPALREQMNRYRAVFKTTPRVLAENIYRAWGARRSPGENDVRKAHESLMQSPGHRDNILLSRVTRIGIGIVANEKGDLWITQMFSRP